jgi:hypothetical protein
MRVCEPKQTGASAQACEARDLFLACKMFPLSHHLSRARNQLKLAILTLWAILAGVGCGASRMETTERKGRIVGALEDFHGFGRDFEGSFSRKTPYLQTDKTD